MAVVGAIYSMLMIEIALSMIARHLSFREAVTSPRSRTIMWQLLCMS